ncbi:hypothetical protein BK008_04565 [Methanobacterium sp. MZ-A1]|uniref:hypothetical protein n=1 Tax=Methanobacterium sp. MZ-A1 TaxID=1911685 RepID=UPI000C2D2A50|nr:hypothetical protein [Methanobacterium sp. MZ-A1]AUB57654.1 hypothetical protein BK008_04565 [Methanobacterium sp. MZ-A1]
MSTKSISTLEIEPLINKFLELYSEIIDFENLTKKLETPQKLGYCEKLVKDNYLIKGPVIDGSLSAFPYITEEYKDFFKFAHGVRLRRMAFNNVPWNNSGPDMLRDWKYGWPLTQINYRNFSSLYSQLEQLYLVNVNRELSCQDLLNIYFGGLDERLFFFLDEFDQITDEEIPTPTKEYFKTLRKVKCKDSVLKQLIYNLEFLIRVSLNKKFQKCDIYTKDEPSLIKGLIYFSAAANKRNTITEEDIIKAYNTHFKLLKTDVTHYPLREDVFKSTNYNSIKAKLVHYSLKLGITHG